MNKQLIEVLSFQQLYWQITNKQQQFLKEKIVAFAFPWNHKLFFTTLKMDIEAIVVGLKRQGVNFFDNLPSSNNLLNFKMFYDFFKNY
jgi:hypothetical protein